MIRDTSRKSLSEFSSLQLSQARRTVFECIRLWVDGAGESGPSIEDISQRTGMKECAVCGRLNELKKIGCVEETGTKKNFISGKTAMTYGALRYRDSQYSNQVTMNFTTQNR